VLAKAAYEATDYFFLWIFWIDCKEDKPPHENYGRKSRNERKKLRAV